jgi:hypothetical protein
MRDRRQRAKPEKRSVVDVGYRGDGPVVSRGPIRRRPVAATPAARGTWRSAPVRRGRGGGFVRLLIFLALLGGAYYALGIYREKIVEAVPQAYPILKAIGIEVSEPVGHGLFIESRADRVRDENQQWVIYVRGKITNKTDRRLAVPRLQITVKSRNARDIVWTVQPDLASLAAGQETTFQSRYNTPFALIDIRSQVKFVNR